MSWGNDGAFWLVLSGTLISEYGKESRLLHSECLRHASGGLITRGRSDGRRGRHLSRQQAQSQCTLIRSRHSGTRSEALSSPRVWLISETADSTVLVTGTWASKQLSSSTRRTDEASGTTTRNSSRR